MGGITISNINTELYKTFIIVAKEESISRAAELLYITQPAVSRAVAQLEEKSGCSLFFRTPKGVKLTTEGAVLYKYIEQAFNFIDLGEKKLNEIKELEDGEVNIGVSDTICRHYLLPILQDFNRDYPKLKIRIVNHTTPIIVDMLRKGKIDLGIGNLPVKDDDLTIQEIIEIQDCFVVGEKYRHLADEVLSINDFSKYPVLMLERGSNSRIYIDNYLEQKHIDLQPEFELGNLDLLVRFAVFDFGIACVIKNFIPEELSSSLLYELTLKETIPSRHIGIIHLKSVPLSSASKRFLSYLT